MRRKRRRLDPENLRFAQARARAALTQTEAAIICGVTLRTVQAWEWGEQGVQEAALRLLEHTAGVSRIGRS